MPRRWVPPHWVGGLLLATLSLGCGRATTPEQRPVTFEKHVVDTAFRAEGVAVADVNGDGALDLVVGSTFYLAPSWAPGALTDQSALDPATSYSDAFAVFAHDFSEDGRVDALVVGFPLGGAVARMQPSGDGHWPQSDLTGPSGTESPLFVTLPGALGPTLLFHRANALRALRVLPDGTSEERELGLASVTLPGHGLGVGDLDGDGRPDVLTPVGVFLGPDGPGEYRFVPADLGPECAQMYVYDVDADGRADVLSSSAHDRGVFWHRQEAPPAEGDRLVFTRHLIDDGFSQSHALAFADLTGDGRPELITGKRRWAHGPTGDVDPNGPAVLYWYTSVATPSGDVQWTRHTLDPEEDSGVGTQFEVADVNADGKNDVVTANKEGVFLFLQRPQADP